MCIAVFKPEGKILSKEIIEQCWDSNSDGAGFMYAEDGKLHIHKGLMSFSNFWKTWKKHQERKAVLHFRIRTHGATDKDNTHPFQVGDSLAFVHNGMINVETKHDETKSDTYHFNQSILKKLYKADTRFIFKPHHQLLVGSFIGYSKLVFMDNKANVVIVNESKGQWDDDVWYSNTSYKPRKVIEPYQPKYSPPVQATSERKSWDGLKVGDRVTVKYHPSLSGNGFISYFGGGSSVGVVLDGNPIVRVVHTHFIFPEKKPVFKTGDYVYYKKARDVATASVGEITGIVGDNAYVEFFDDTTGQDITAVCSLDELDHWENLGCAV